MDTEAGQQVLAMAQAAERRLAEDVQVINALNVFPVPDGDTGTNMLSTIREALAHVAEPLPPSMIPERLALGAMLGARGNSGVLLSQLFRAQDEALRQREGSGPLSASDLAAIFARARELAYAAVSNPVEGTLLSLLSALAPAARELDGARPAGDLLGHLLAVAEKALAATPQQLPILREAGVVDSGGYGLLMLLRGWHEALCGEEPPAIAAELLGLERARAQAASGSGHPADLVGAAEAGYGYCVTLLVDAPNAVHASVREQLALLGDSILVVAIDRRLKLHVHVPDPEPVLRLACDLGSISRSEISNIDRQTSGEAATALPIVAAASGEGLASVFRSLGARVIAGGQTQNPSTAEFLEAARRLTGPVFLLPNNGNSAASAQQAAASSDNLFVVRTTSVPQGIAAVLAYDAQASPEVNLQRMGSAAAGVSTAELVTAVRSARLEGIDIAAGETMVILDGTLLGVNEPGMAALLSHIQAREPELATIYYGLEASEETAAELRDRLLSGKPDLEVEIVRGHQPHAQFVIGLE